MSFGAARQQAASSQERSRLRQRQHGIYKRQTISLTPFPLQLNIYKNNERQTAQQWGLFVNFLKLLGVGLVISTTLAYYFANRFLYPFRVLAKAARQAGKHMPLRKIPDEPFEGKRFSSISIRRKILLLLAVSVIVPGIFFGVSINRVMYAYTMDQNKEFSLETSRQMVLKLRNKMDEYETDDQAAFGGSAINNVPGDFATSCLQRLMFMFLLCPIIHRCTAFRISFFTTMLVLPGIRPYSQTTCLCLMETDTPCRTLMGMERERFSG